MDNLPNVFAKVFRNSKKEALISILKGDVMTFYGLDLCYMCEKNCVKSPFVYIEMGYGKECDYNQDLDLIVEKFIPGLVDIVIETF
jgi:hypothetical protein